MGSGSVRSSVREQKRPQGSSLRSLLSLSRTFGPPPADLPDGSAELERHDPHGGRWDARRGRGRSWGSGDDAEPTEE